MFYQVSGEGLVWTIVGGAGTLFGPIVGTTLFVVIREVVSTRPGAPFADCRRDGHCRRHPGARKVWSRLWHDALDTGSLHPRRDPSGSRRCGPSHERSNPAHRKPDQEIRRLDRDRQSQGLNLPGGQHCRRSSDRTAPRQETTFFNLHEVSGLLRRPTAADDILQRSRHHRLTAA